MFRAIVQVIDVTGALRVALSMHLESALPLQACGLILPLAGFVAANGHASLWLTIPGGSVDTPPGTVLYFWIGRKVEDRSRARVRPA